MREFLIEVKKIASHPIVQYIGSKLIDAGTQQLAKRGYDISKYSN